jgi:hypothetical protein
MPQSSFYNKIADVAPSLSKYEVLCHSINESRNPVGFLPEVRSFACPGIDTLVQGTTVINLIRQTLYSFVCALARLTLLKLQVKCVNHSTSRPGQACVRFPEQTETPNVGIQVCKI